MLTSGITQFSSHFQLPRSQSCGFVQGNTYLSTRRLDLSSYFIQSSKLHLESHKISRPTSFTFSASRTLIYLLASYLCLSLRFYHLHIFLFLGRPQDPSHSLPFPKAKVEWEYVCTAANTRKAELNRPGREAVSWVEETLRGTGEDIGDGPSSSRWFIPSHSSTLRLIDTDRLTLALPTSPQSWMHTSDEK